MNAGELPVRPRSLKQSESPEQARSQEQPGSPERLGPPAQSDLPEQPERAEAPEQPEQPRPPRRMLNHGALQSRRPPSRRGIMRRRWFVNGSKYLLPLLAIALLGSIAAWPEIARMHDQRLLAGPASLGENVETQVKDARYRGLDQRGEPYTITAAIGRQASADRIDLTTPKGDVTQQSGEWLMVQSDTGVYMQHASLLDLSGNVIIYRDDGTTLHTPAATVDLQQGAAAGSAMVHAEGPFGTLDAQGFALTDKGNVIQFTGPAHLLLNGSGT